LNNFSVFLGKEFMENKRAKRFFVLACVFLFFAFSSPVMARYMSEVLAFLLGADPALDGMVAAFGEPHWVDSYLQFYGNIIQIGVMTIILLFMGCVLREKQRNTADLIFTKGLTPAQFIAAKFIMASLGIIIIFFISILINYIYTLILFGEAGRIIDILLGGAVSIVFLIMMLAFVIFCSTIAKSTGIVAVLGFLGFIAIAAISALPRIGQWLPGNLTPNAALLLSMGQTPENLLWNLIIAIAMTAGFLLLSVQILKKQEL